jgi:hypothetical protein
VRHDALILFSAAVLAGCTTPGARTLVYAFDDGEPVGQLDRDTCVVGVGLRVDLGPTQSITFDIAADQKTAVLGTCDLEAGIVSQCFVFDPLIPLEIDGSIVTGEGMATATTGDADCPETDLVSRWRFELDESAERFDAEVQVEWDLPETDACDAFEARILETSPGNGRVDGCLVDYAFSGTQVATCRVDAVSGLLECN